MARMLADHIVELRNYVIALADEVNDLHRRMASVMIPGKVVDTDPKKGLVKVAYQVDREGKDVTTTWIRWSTRSGKIKVWQPPSKGEQITLFNPGGDITGDSWAMPGGYWDDEPFNHDKDHELRTTVEDENIDTSTKKSRLIQVEDFTVECKNFKVKSDNVKFETAQLQRVEAGKVEYANGGSGAGYRPRVGVKA